MSRPEGVARITRIAELNDLSRTAMGVAGRLLQTEGISALPSAVQSRIRERVETFNEFTPDNDPYGERDFGGFEEAGERIFWKIDYYDRTLEYGSEDPSDPSQTTPRAHHHAGLGVLGPLTTTTEAGAPPGLALRRDPMINSFRYRAPLDPDCPVVDEYLTTLYDDPMTAASGCGDEIAALFERRHRATCSRCQAYGAENIGVEETTNV